MARGFICLAAVVDWYSRRVLAWRRSITMEAGFYVEAQEDALARHGRPGIFNIDQDSQVTSYAGFWVTVAREGRRIEAGVQACQNLSGESDTPWMRIAMSFAYVSLIISTIP